ncbi:autotransporter outer membrane beta-barrel domain-containing protein [Megamonas funiformis]|uniref:autotransporter outer membrane beta-barrel domain-containing protein n=1 Tax=Megamonas funiformis TaxID=437897 RepID=UPI0026DC40DF|nr:autotransporter outer membrane beta-barrel domain-containing protein [Megamonas funiformis]
MKKKLIKRAIFFMISCNMVVFTPTWASQETKNTITSSSIEVSDGSIKNIVNDDINIIDTNVRDEYGIFSNNGGKLNIDVDSLTIEHNIDRSNMFTSILSQGNTSQGSSSLIDIKTINDINIDNTAQELEQINAINAKDNANLNLLSKNGDININSNLNINRRLYDVNNSIINVENNSALKLDAKNMNINSTITDSYGQRLFNNYGINIKNSQLNINNQENMQINSTISGRGFDNYGVYVYDNLNQGSKVDIVNNGDLIINTNDNSSRNHSYGIFVINENNTDDETSVNINSKNNVVNTKSTGIEVSGELSNVNITASAGSNVIKALGDVDSTGIEVNDNGMLYLNAKDYNIVTSDYTGIHVSYADDKQSNITLNANNNIVNAVGTGILSFSNGNIKLNALNGNNAFTSNYIGISLMDNSQVNLKADKGENYFKIDEGIAILSSQSNVLAQANKNILEGIEGISSIDKSEVKLQATDSNIINAKEFGIYTKEQGVVSLNATNANNTVYVDGGYGISGNASAININSQSGNNSIEVAQGIAIEANNGSNISVNANKGQNNIKASDTAISVNKNNIDKDIATTSTNTVVKVTGKNNIINATTAIDNIDDGNVEIIASENNSIDGLVHAENKANTKIQGKVNYLKNDKDNAIESNNANVLVQGNENIIEATKGISSIDESEVKLQAIDSNTINAKEFGIYTKEQGAANLNATNTDNIVYVENGYGISGNNSVINIDSQSGNNSIEVAKGIAIEVNNGSNISVNANKGQNNIKASDTAISVNKNNIDKDIATISTSTVVKIAGKDNIINATTAIDNIDSGNVEIIASENNSIDGLIHVENKANTKIQGKVNYLKNDKDNTIESNNANVLVQGSENVIEATNGISTVNNGIVNLQATDSNTIKAQEFGIYTKENSQVNLNAINADNIVYVDNGYGISGNNSSINIDSQSGNNSIEVGQGIAIEANNGSNISVNANKGQNNIKASDTAISVNKNNIDKDIATTSTNTVVKVTGKNNIINATTAIDNIDDGNVEIIASENNSINGLVHAENKANTKIQGKINYLKNDKDNAVESNNANVFVQGSENIIEAIKGISSIDKSEVKLQATDSNVINAKNFGIYTKEEGVVNLNATNADNIVYVETGYGISGNDSAININSQSGNNSIEVTQGIAIEANNGSNISLNANKGQNNIKASDIAISVNKNNIDKDIAITSTNTVVKIAGKDNIINATTAIDNINGGNVEIIASENNSINGLVHAENKANTKIQGKINYLKNDKDNAIESNNANVLVQGSENIIEATKGISSIDKSEVKLQATDSNVINAKNFGIYTKEEGVVNLNATNADNIVYVETGYGISGNDSAININSQSGNNSIEVTQGIAIEANNGSNISLNANKGQNNIKASDIAISVNKNNIDKDIAITSTNTVVKIAGKDNIINATTAIDNINGGNVEIIASENNSIDGLVNVENKANTKIQGKVNYLKNDKDNAIESNNANVLVQGNENIIEATKGISNVNNGMVNLQSTNRNIIKAKEFGVYTKENSQVNLNTVNADNIVYVDNGYGISGNNSSINIDSQSGNNSIEVGQGIAIEANNGSNISVNANKGQNNIKASDTAISVNKNNIDKDIATTSTNTVVKVTGKNNIINATTAIDNIDDGNVEIIASENNSINGLVHAENKANTKIQGKVNYLKNDNGQSIIWADAGTIDITGTSIIQANSQQVALLANNDINNLNQGIITASFGQNSVIKGDIIAKDNGLIKLNVSNSNDDVSGLIIEGNILAENQGNISLDIGNNSLITGNINDYSYLADLNNQNLKQENLAGNISIDFNNKSRWNVVGQSFISKINTKENNIIDMVGYNTENKPHSLMVKEFNGDSNFVMNLNGNRQNTDMVYLNSGTGNYNVILANAVTKKDIGQNGLRFATVGDKNKQVFKNAVAYNDGFFNIKYQIASEDYDVNNGENTLYNNGDNSDLLTENRPGNNIINNIFGNNEDAVNYKLVNIEEKTLSNAGKTILNMTKANYDVAVFMGRLDKRMGDVHYLNKNDDGIWFRLRHDRIEKDLGYTVDGNMYELGYDKLFLRDNGQERLGLAFDYMKGSTSYDDIAGKGNNSRKGIWLYDTWIGDDGHYSDYILKWGHLENDFEIAGTKKLNLIKGNYDNDVFSASAEYGYMKNLKNDWYITPQVQLQLAKVTGADYITNQNTNVHVDGIDSIIGRAGFKLGKNFGDNKKNTFYLKADVLREFLGEQFVSVKDVTSDNEYVGFKYDHSGYWYDVGFGFNIETKKDSYAFLDVERRFGNGNKNSYQINGGFYWAL